jgi:hypothetical protein
MITDEEIKLLFDNIINESNFDFIFRYVAPVAVNSGHGLEFENKLCIGVFTAWPSGLFDWSSFKVENSEPFQIGHSSFSSIEELRLIISKTMSLLN